jgi:hypothetical protein
MKITVSCAASWGMAKPSSAIEARRAACCRTGGVMIVPLRLRFRDDWLDENHRVLRGKLGHGETIIGYRTYRRDKWGQRVSEYMIGPHNDYPPRWEWMTEADGTIIGYRELIETECECEVRERQNRMRRRNQASGWCYRNVGYGRCRDGFYTKVVEHRAPATRLGICVMCGRTGDFVRQHFADDHVDYARFGKFKGRPDKGILAVEAAHSIITTQLCFACRMDLEKLRRVMCECEELIFDADQREQQRGAVILELVQRRPSLVIHNVGDEVTMARWCEVLWPGKRVTALRKNVEAEYAARG